MAFTTKQDKATLESDLSGFADFTLERMVNFAIRFAIRSRENLSDKLMHFLYAGFLTG